MLPPQPTLEDCFLAIDFVNVCPQTLHLYSSTPSSEVVDSLIIVEKYSCSALRLLSPHSHSFQ